MALALGGIVLTLLFLLVEHRAKEPVIPLKLFRLRVFQASSAIGFVMGFAMFGAVTFLPLFLQDVKNVSPTLSGLRLFPLMFGLFGASIISGRLVTRWGRYKIFPILGTACMTLGAFLLSLIGIETSALVTAFYMFVFGVGLGLTQQVLVVAVQNAVSYEDLGVATSGATFFRMIGGSFGTAVFGAIYANVLQPQTGAGGHLAPQGDQGQSADAGSLHAAPVGPSVPRGLRQNPRCDHRIVADRLPGRRPHRSVRVPPQLVPAGTSVAPVDIDARSQRRFRAARASFVAPRN